MIARDAGQGAASYAAFCHWYELSDRASVAGIEVRRLERELREARKRAKQAEAEEAAAMKAYEQTPWSDDAE